MDQSLPTHYHRSTLHGAQTLHTTQFPYTTDTIGARPELFAFSPTNAGCLAKLATESHLGAHSPSPFHLHVPEHPHIQRSSLQETERERGKRFTNPLTALGRLSLSLSSHFTSHTLSSIQNVCHPTDVLLINISMADKQIIADKDKCDFHQGGCRM